MTRRLDRLLRGRRITLVVTLLMASLILLTVVSMTASEVVGQRALFERQLEGKGRALSRTLNDVMADALYFRDIEALRHLADVAKAQPEIANLTVFDPDGRILIGPGAEKFASGSVPEDVVNRVAGSDGSDIRVFDGHVELLAPVIVSGELIGGLRFELDSSGLEAQVRETVATHLIQGGLFMLFGIGLSYLFAQSIVRPVRELTLMTDRIAAGDLDASTEGKNRDDEIGDLARSLRTMADNLREAERRKAEQRTAQLRAANEKLLAEIGERKRAQQDSERSRDELERALAELRRTQQKMVQQERLSAVGQLSSGIAHDINNRLQVISALTDRLRLDGDDDSERRDDDLELIRDSVKDASNVVALLSDFYRPQAQSESLEPVRIGDIARSAVQLTEPRWKDVAQSRGIDLDVRTSIDDLPVIDGSPVELREALINLLFNAIDALPAGGVIELRAFAADGQVVVEVRDSGVGMSGEVRRRCLEPFFTTKGERGSGLGLATVFRAVRRHEGQVEIDSEPGSGTTVRLLLPARQSAKAVPAEHVTPSTSGALRILVVDDEPLVLKLVGRLLEHDGHAVSAAQDGRTALEEFRSAPFDLVILDRAMPDMNGDELALHIKRRAPHTPVIMLSGFGDLMNATGEQPAGVDMTLSKPIRHADLSAAVAEAVEAATRRAAPAPAS